MTSRFKFLYFFYAFWLFFTIKPIFTLNGFAHESLKINLNQELKKGNFLIGLKQYLGANSNNISEKQNITFKTKKNFLELHTSNGIEYKSKKIDIIFKEIPLKTPLTIERLVFGPFASYESAERQANKLKEKAYEAIVAFPKNWEVWTPVSENPPDPRLNYKFFKKSYNSRIIPFLVDQYSKQKLEGPIHIFSSDEIKINGVIFGNNFYLVRDSYGTWTLIQKIKFDDYLKGVLPYEIGPNSPLEALKAQAVIARTWAIYNSERFNIDHYHLCISTQCQVYRPPEIEYKNVQKAIKDTSNLIITYKNKPINSFYHASNGGISAMASESWNISDKSYFNAKLDNSKSINNSFKLPMSNEFKLNQFLSIEKEKFYGSNHSRFRWEKTISSLMVRDYLIKNNFLKVHENISSLTVLERGPSGRVTKLKISTDSINKTIILAKDDIRRTLSFLPSNLFTINKLNDNLWLFSGGGFGHGVGLSQSAAIEMAELGFTYEQILDRYYQGTSIQKIETLSQ